MGREKSYWAYILASRIGGTLYIGVTNNLVDESMNTGWISQMVSRKSMPFIVSYTSNNTVTLRQQSLVKSA